MPATLRPVRVLLTRPAGDSARMARALAGEGTTGGAECLIWPLSRIVALTDRVEVPAGTEALLITSPNGLRAFAAGSDRRDLAVLAVGDGSAAAAREAGFAEVTSARGDARDLARLALASRWRRLLHPRGRHVVRDLAGELSAAGLEVAEAIVYAAEPAGPAPRDVARALAAGAVDLVTVWSPRHGALLAERLAEAPAALGKTDLLGISANAVAPLGEVGFRRVAIAARPDAAAMLDWISGALQR